MTPTQIISAARNKYNAIGDSFFSDDEMLDLIYQAQCEMAVAGFIIESTYTTSTVISQQEYTLPSNCIGIKRITYNGKKLKPINFREDDTITGLNASTSDTGTPQYYAEWNDIIYLRPIPDSVGTLKIFSESSPSTLSISSTLEIPDHFHMTIVDFITGQMASKDLNFTLAKMYGDRWEMGKLEAVKWQRKKKRRDSFASVQDEDKSIEGFLGIV